LESAETILDDDHILDDVKLDTIREELPKLVSNLEGCVATSHRHLLSMSDFISDL